jgi:hypothetical protein
LFFIVQGFIIPPPPPPRVNLSPSTNNNNNNNNQSKVASHATMKASPQPPLSHSHSKSDQNIHTNANFDFSINRQSKPLVDSTSNYSTLPKVSFTDREIHEIKVAKETFYKEPKEKISPRIASIQKMLANPGNNSQVSTFPSHKLSKTYSSVELNVVIYQRYETSFLDKQLKLFQERILVDILSL